MSTDQTKFVVRGQFVFCRFLRRDMLYSQYDALTHRTLVFKTRNSKTGTWDLYSISRWFHSKCIWECWRRDYKTGQWTRTLSRSGALPSRGEFPSHHRKSLFEMGNVWQGGRFESNRRTH